MAMTRLALRLQFPVGNDRLSALGWVARMPAHVVSCAFNYVPVMLRSLTRPLTHLYRHFWLPASTQQNAARLEARARNTEPQGTSTEELPHFHARLRLARVSAVTQSVAHATGLLRQAVTAIAQLPSRQRQEACAGLIDTCASCLPEKDRDCIWEEMRQQFMHLPHAGREPMFDAIMAAGGAISALYRTSLLDYLWPYLDNTPKALDAMRMASREMPSSAGYRAVCKITHGLVALPQAGRHVLLKQILDELPYIESPYATAIVCDLMAYAPLLEGNPEHGATAILKAIGNPSLGLAPEQKRGLIMIMRDGLQTIRGTRTRSDLRAAIDSALAGLPKPRRLWIRRMANDCVELESDVQCRNFALLLTLAKTYDNALVSRLHARSLTGFNTRLSRLGEPHPTDASDDRKDSIRRLLRWMCLLPPATRRDAATRLIDACMRDLPQEQWVTAWNWLVYDHMFLPGRDRKPAFDAVWTNAASIPYDLLTPMFQLLWPYEVAGGQITQGGLDTMAEICCRFPSQVACKVVGRVVDCLDELSPTARGHTIKEVLGVLDKLEPVHVVPIVHQLIAAAAQLPVDRAEGYVPILRLLDNPLLRLDAAQKRSLLIAMIRKLAAITSERSRTESFHALMTCVAGLPHEQQGDFLGEAAQSAALRPVDEGGAERFGLLLSTIGALPAALRTEPLERTLRLHLDLFLRKLAPDAAAALRGLIEQLQALGASGRAAMERSVVGGQRNGLGDLRASLFDLGGMPKVAQRS